MNSTTAQRIESNLRAVRQRIKNAAERAGRDPRDVTLLAVTKYVSAEVARVLVAAGCNDLGESRPQELWSKAEALADLPVRWHLVGHLQRNKAKRTIPNLSLLHSLDSLDLAGELDRLARAAGRRLSVLVEVNVSLDATKHGFVPDSLVENVLEISTLPGLQLRGLMTMAHREGGPEVAREDFRILREMRDEVARRLPESVTLSELSMGMSDDFEVAIEEGATLIRVGSALFEGCA